MKDCFLCDQRCVNHRWVYVRVLVECFQKIGDKLKVSGVVIDQNRMEGYSPCMLVSAWFS